MNVGLLKNKLVMALLQPLRYILVRCVICNGKRSIQTEESGWIKCPACDGNGVTSLAEKLMYNKVRRMHDARGSVKP